MPQPVTLEMAAEVVAAFVSNNPLPRGEPPALIQTIHDTLARLSAGVENSTPKEEPNEPAVSIRKSVTPGYLICLEDGKHFKSLKRHLAAHGLTPEQYRAKWKLPSDYPMVAANYAASWSAMAKMANEGGRKARSNNNRRVEAGTPTVRPYSIGSELSTAPAGRSRKSLWRWISAAAVSSAGYASSSCGSAT